jgi:glycosyltransferase involved in cell wall biosynthesis
MPLAPTREDYLLFVGRITAEKGIAEAIELAQRVHLPLKIAAKVHDESERELHEELVAPAAGRGGVEFLGELLPSARDPLYSKARPL